MAFGLSPKYIQDVPLDNLTPEQFLVLAIEAAKKLDWNIAYASETGFVAFTKFSMRSWSEEVKVKIDGNNATLKSECTGNQLVDWGKNEDNLQNLISTFNELKSKLTSEELAQKYEELKPKLVSKEEQVLNQTPSTSREKLVSVLAIFKPTQGYVITPILINLNIIFFIMMVLSGVNLMQPDNGSLIKWGANFRPVTLDGEWWRLIQNCFLHIGILHLFMNMYALVYIGLLLEPHLGEIRFIAAYLLTGISASITSLWWHDMTISAGASGAIFGMYGVFLAMLTTNLIEKSTRKALMTSIVVFVGYNLLSGMGGGVDNAAHIGGLVVGLIIGYAYYPSLKNPEAVKLKYSIVAIVTVLVLSTSFIVYTKTPNDIGEYTTKMKSFASMEIMALDIYSLPKDTPKDKLLSEIKKIGLYYWNENFKLVSELDKLNLPDELHEKNKKLLKYCDLRIKSYNLIYKAVDEDTDRYKDSIDAYGKEIEALIRDLTVK